MKKDLISIKGTINGLVIYIDSSAELSELSAELTSKIESRPGFFKNARFRIFAEGDVGSDTMLALENICSSHGMTPSQEINWPYQAISKAEKDNPIDKKEFLSAKQEILSAQQEIAATTVKNNLQSSSVSGQLADQNTLLIQKNLRSGQKLQYEGNLVILGDVNPGAEITAGGDIVVMGSLRGIAHAGAMGNENAVILAYRLEPTQLRIANKITRPPEKDLSINQPELARLSNGQMYIEPYSSQRTTWDFA